MSRTALQSLRWCQIVNNSNNNNSSNNNSNYITNDSNNNSSNSSPLSGALWMPMGRMDSALR